MYKPLDSTLHQIRLIDVTLAVDGSIIRQSQHASLDVDPEPDYETISYCWGDPTFNHSIVLDREELIVPRNTFLVLQRFAKPSIQRTLWIDAVCINQKDNVEKAQQVPLMRMIYSMSKGNLVYLGDDADGLATKQIEALQFVLKQISLAAGKYAVETQDEFEGIKAHLRESDHPGNGFHDEFAHYVGAAFNGEVDITEADFGTDFDETAILAFFSRPWFTRVWIVQEGVLSKSSICVCGDHEINLDSILRVATWFALHPAYNIKSGFQQNAGMSNAMSMREQQDAHIFMDPGAGPSFNLIFAACIGLGCSDLRDKVFGILGLCKPATTERGLDQLVRPDYSKSKSEVMRDATRYCLSTFDPSSTEPFMLRAISHREGDLANGGHVSWMPVYDQEADFTVDDSSLFVHHKLTRTAQLEADLNLLTNMDNPNALLLRVRTLDTITQLSPVLSHERSHNSGLLRQWLSNAASLVAKYTPGRSASLSRVLIADTNHRRERATAKDLSPGWDDLQDWLADDGSIDILQNMQPPDAKSLYWRSLVHASRHRRLAVTQTGYLALVPKVTKMHDIIAFVHADTGGTPYVFRQVGQDCKLVGMAYVDGVMPGQGDWEKTMGALEEQIFKVI